jgi:primosomal protein N' (replication factor Y)
MFAQVILFSGYKKPLWYKIPHSYGYLKKGTIVTVPLQSQTVFGLVQFVQSHVPFDSINLKDIIAINQFPEDAHYFKFLEQLAALYYIDVNSLFSRIVQFLRQLPKKEFLINTPFEQKNNDLPQMTDEQEKVIQFLKPRIEKGIFSATLLCGVTGSGKTEVYKALILHAIALEKTVLFLLPEISLALAFTKRLSFELPPAITIVGFHAAASNNEKKTVWNYVVNKKPLVIIGVHMPVFLPLSNLGFIIVDEEHEFGYQEKRFPKINSKQAALLRASSYSVPILLGSATPSISSLHQVKLKKWYFFQLTQRFGGQLPSVHVIELNKEKKRPHFWITNQLYDAIVHRLAKKEQCIIFLNRRGYAFCVQCFNCGFVFECTACSVRLTLHDKTILKCHYCNAQQQLSSECPQCKKESSFIKKGIGTQQAVEILEKLFPNARIARADLDSTQLQKKWQATYTDFINGNIDILVGTQTIAKGHHFPHVTLVGVLWADMNLHFPFFYATEIALQQLIQVSGRAGRTSQSSEVIMQIIEKHDIFDLINESSYLKFYQNEIEHRISAGYPPYRFLIEITLQHKKYEIINEESHMLATLLQQNIHQLDQVSILGPTLPLIARIQNIESRIIYIKAYKKDDTDNLIHLIKKQKLKSSLFITPLF